MAIKFQSATNNPIRKYLLGPLLLPPVTMMHEHQIIPPVGSTVPPTPVRPPVTPTPVISTPGPTATPAPVISTPGPAVTPTPVICTAVRPAVTPSPLRPAATRHQSTKQLINTQNRRRSLQDSGRKFVSRPLLQRCKEQNQHFLKIADEVHHGKREDFLAGIAFCASNAKSSFANSSEEEWDGSITVQDIIDLAKMVQDPKTKKTIYETLTVDVASEVNFVSKLEILKMQDSSSQKETFRNLRKLLHGFFDSERKTDQLKSKWHKEFEVVWQPSRTATGWKINPHRLHECLKFAYPWLKDVDCEWWRLYGDARNYGGQKSVLIAVSNINNEAMFNNCSFQSPEECWPIHMFYGSDSRVNLELNFGGKSNYINNWINRLSEGGHQTFVACDNMFANAILGGGLDPKSSDNFSLYAFETTATRSEVGKTKGLRSEVNREIEREHPDSLLSAVPTKHFIPCANHMFARITEHLLTLRIMSCLEEITGSSEKNTMLTKLLSNINVRGVRGGNFQVKFDGPKLEQITLNVTHAETISAPPEAFSSPFPHILDGVARKDIFPQKLSSGLQAALNLPSANITYYDLEKKLWDTHWDMHVLCRKDPDPRKSNQHLLSDASHGSDNVKDYRFGLLESEVTEYRRLADLHHGLMLLRYGSSRLYPYLMTRVDIVPILLKELPFHSLFRGSIEGGEHCHYLHQCQYYAHSSRGGGWRKDEPILALFRWTYRRFREKIAEEDELVNTKFQKYVERCFREAGGNFASDIVDQELETNRQCTESPPPTQREEPHEDQTNETPENQSQQTDIPLHQHDSALYRRGATVYFSSTPASDLSKGMMLELTPRKQHARVATSSRERPTTIDVQHLKEPPPLPLRNQTFVISGNISERNDKEKFTTEKLTILIKQLGGEVFAGDIEKAVEAKFIVISSQKEVNRPLNKMNKTLIMAYRLGWHIVSKSIIIDARDSDTMPSTSSHLLDVTNLKNAPSTSIVHAKVTTRGNMVDNHHVIGAHRELKKKLRESNKRLRCNDKSTEKQKPPKKQCTSYVMFSKTTWKTIVKEYPHYSMSQINCLISEMWKELDEEGKQVYKDLAAEHFEACQEQLIDKETPREARNI